MGGFFCSPKKRGFFMKELLKFHDVAVEINGEVILEKMSMTAKKGERIGIIGRNGAGKSTLLRFLNGEMEAIKGQVEWKQENVSIAYVEQEKEEYEQVKTSYAHLSGGEKLKVRLRDGFAKQADLLLLDEPTNHLDEQNIELLSKQMKKYAGTIIVVSHDRFFLDEVATKIWAIEGNELVEHKGNYSSYIEAREAKRLRQQRMYEKQQKKIALIEGQMAELTSWSKKAHAESTKQEGAKEYYRLKAKRMDAQVKSKRRRLEKELEQEKVERVEEDHLVRFSIAANEKRGRRFLEVAGLTKKVGDRLLFEDVNFTIQHGERVALIGPNGSGKTTFLKIVMGEEQGSGEVWISPAAQIGYLTQEVFDLPLNETPAQLFYQTTFADRGKVQSLMNHLGFQSKQWTQPIGEMSMGERVKCKLMVYILEEKDVLILDEPTNHLDLPSREQLEQVLAQYAGTLLVASHDRYFLEKITNRQLLFSNRTIQAHIDEALFKKDEVAEQLLQLETERQAVLGKLSLLTAKDEEYKQLDRRFFELTKQIKELS